MTSRVNLIKELEEELVAGYLWKSTLYKDKQTFLKQDRFRMLQPCSEMLSNIFPAISYFQ